MQSIITPGFASRRNSSFIMAFENGLKVSVCWSRNCYCDRYEFGTEPSLDLEAEIVTSPNAEVAITQDRVLMNWGNNTVMGEMSPDQVATVIQVAQAAKPVPEGQLRLVELGLLQKSVHNGPLEMARRKLVELGLATDPIQTDYLFEFNP